MTKNPHSLSIAEILRLLQADQTQGLSTAEAAKRLASKGPNEIQPSKKIPSWRKLLRQFESPVVLVLVGAVILSLFLGDRVDAVAIAAILTLNALIGYFQESKAEKAVGALKLMTAPKAKVLRNGKVLEVPSREVALGDILVVEAGDYVAADARVLEARQLSANEAALTGESLPVIKNAEPLPAETIPADRINMLFSGTALSAGSGKALVTATAMETEFGRIAGMLSTPLGEATPLQKRLEKVSRSLLWFCAGAILLVGALELFRGQSWLETLMIAVSLAVAAIPEGLPAVVTLALALAVSRMSRKKALVRRLQAVETLGSTDVICTDKTGTLTTGQMEVREILAGGNLLKREEMSDSDPKVKELLLSCAANSSATLSEDGKGIGDPTELALLELAKEKGIKTETVHGRMEWPFDSDRKRMSVAGEYPEGILIHVKGAAESVLPLCGLEETERKSVERTIEELSSRGRRLLAVAIRRLDPKTFSSKDLSTWDWEKAEKDLSFLGLVSLADPPRPEAMRAIQDCKKAGIKVVMITGDHPATAKAIALEMGILEPEVFDKVLAGAELEKMTDEGLQEIVEQTAVYARVSPEHKLRIVKAWQALGKVVAMTGDGVNDAPALQQASIGISMGKGGTEVARQASAMVLADDNFATIVSAVAEGRAIHDNIRRTLQYLLTGNTGEILVMLGAALMGWPVPLLPIHLLWINLVTDGFPALALAAEPVPKDILATSKRPSAASFSERGFYLKIGLIGSLVGLLTLGVYGFSLHTADEITARSNAFSFLVFEELFRSFASRSDLKPFLRLEIFGNKVLLAAVGLPILFQAGLNTFPAVAGIFKVHSISLTEYGILLCLALIPVTLIEAGKILKGGHQQSAVSR